MVMMMMVVMVVDAPTLPRNSSKTTCCCPSVSPTLYCRLRTRGIVLQFPTIIHTTWNTYTRIHCRFFLSRAREPVVFLETACDADAFVISHLDECAPIMCVCVCVYPSENSFCLFSLSALGTLCAYIVCHRIYIQAFL